MRKTNGVKRNNRFFFEIDKTNKEGLAFFHKYYQENLLREKKYDCIEEELVAVFNTIIQNENARVELKGKTRSIVAVGEFQPIDQTNPRKRSLFNEIMFLSRGAIRQIKTEGVFFQPYKNFNRKSIILVDYHSPGQYLQERYRRMFHDGAPAAEEECLQSLYDCFVRGTGKRINRDTEFILYSNEKDRDKILDDMEAYSHGQVKVVERNCEFDLCFEQRTGKNRTTKLWDLINRIEIGQEIRVHMMEATVFCVGYFEGAATISIDGEERDILKIRFPGWKTFVEIPVDDIDALELFY